MVNVRPIALDFSGGEFRLCCGERDWCDVYMVENGTETQLGAAPLGYLVSHLMKFLEAPAAELRWIMSLSERHYSAYGSADAGGGVIVLVQNESATTVGRIRVTNDERQAWLNSLTPFSER